MGRDDGGNDVPRGVTDTRAVRDAGASARGEPVAVVQHRYLLVWGATGLLAYGVFRLGGILFGGDLAWHSGGRWFAGGVLAVAALYELTPLKDVCLQKCRSPLGFLIGAWRDGARGALQMGARHAGWCVGCCWALMATLLALGVMSLVWMAFVAALITLQKTLPWRRVVTRSRIHSGHPLGGQPTREAGQHEQQRDEPQSRPHSSERLQ